MNYNAVFKWLFITKMVVLGATGVIALQFAISLLDMYLFYGTGAYTSIFENMISNGVLTFMILSLFAYIYLWESTMKHHMQKYGNFSNISNY